MRSRRPIPAVVDIAARLAARTQRPTRAVVGVARRVQRQHRRRPIPVGAVVARRVQQKHLQPPIPAADVAGARLAAGALRLLCRLRFGAVWEVGAASSRLPSIFTCRRPIDGALLPSAAGIQPAVAVDVGASAVTAVVVPIIDAT